MTNPKSAYPHETQPVGKTAEDQQRNADLLGGYDYEKYATALTGFTGQEFDFESTLRTVRTDGNHDDH